MTQMCEILCWFVCLLFALTKQTIFESEGIRSYQLTVQTVPVFRSEKQNKLKYQLHCTADSLVYIYCMSMFISAARLGILTWELMSTYSVVKADSSGHVRNCRFWYFLY